MISPIRDWAELDCVLSIWAGRSRYYKKENPATVKRLWEIIFYRRFPMKLSHKNCVFPIGGFHFAVFRTLNLWKIIL